MMGNKAYFVVLSITMVFLFGCEKADNESQNACKSANPVEEVMWLKRLKSEMTNCNCELSIIKGSIKGQTVFYIGMTDALCNGISNPIFYDCYGNIVKTPADNDYQEYYESVVIEQVLYRCKTTK